MSRQVCDKCGVEVGGHCQELRALRAEVSRLEGMLRGARTQFRLQSDALFTAKEERDLLRKSRDAWREEASAEAIFSFGLLLPHGQDCAARDGYDCDCPAKYDTPEEE